MNCSAAAARHLASGGVYVYTALAGAVGALYGPLHGGANEVAVALEKAALSDEYFIKRKLYPNCCWDAQNLCSII
ncbi:hypothetical protein SLEP1_g55349 [Rubroshorea leprosula]|uniref:Citrate synthase n=1 Tax=Rubroshorea leprosula TaxID=152421 RepID=A0AAV5MF38_9ROSI|nr:hypothetical protein SLEP1_g55349 [Rubroshorea leprosula]